MKFVFEGILDGPPVIIFEFVWRVSNDVAPEWPSGDSRWLLHIDGDPSVDSEFVLATEEDAGQRGLAVGRHPVLNAVPTVVSAPPRAARQPHPPAPRRGLRRPKGRVMTDDDRTAVLETSLIIGDRRVDDSKGGWMEHINPATRRPNPKKISVASVEEVDDAVTAAREGFKVWRSWTPDKRRDALFKLADVLREQCAARDRGRGRDRRSLQRLRRGLLGRLDPGLRGWADKITGESINAYPFPGIDYTKPEPYGVVAVFVASNGPTASSAWPGRRRSWPAAPSSSSPRSSRRTRRSSSGALRSKRACRRAWSTW